MPDTQETPGQELARPYCEEDRESVPDDPCDEGPLEDRPLVTNIEWWHRCDWKEILLATADATILFPESVTHAVAERKYNICAAIEEARSTGDTQGECSCWKLLMAVDMLMFHNIKSDGGGSIPPPGHCRANAPHGQGPVGSAVGQPEPVTEG